MSAPLNPDAYACMTLQAEYRNQMERYAAFRKQARELRDDAERIDAKAMTASERATSIMETLLKLEQPRGEVVQP